MQDFWGPCVFNNFGSMARGSIAGSYGNSVFNFLKNCQTLSRVLYKYKDHVFHFISTLETVCQDKNLKKKILNKRLEILRTCILSKASRDKQRLEMVFKHQDIQKVPSS